MFNEDYDRLTKKFGERYFTVTTPERENAALRELFEPRSVICHTATDMEEVATNDIERIMPPAPETVTLKEYLVKRSTEKHP